MTIAGVNCRVDVWRYAWADDDSTGGAVTTGTLYYQDIMARIQANPEQQLIMQQGLETVRTYTVTLIPGTLDIRERDEIEVVKPTDHHYYGDFFRVIGVRYTDLNPRDPRNYMILQTSRSERAHSKQ